MISVLANWLYIIFICTAIGCGGIYIFERLISPNTPAEGSDISLTHCFIAGVVISTVYSEFFSLFSNIGAIAHIVILILAIICTIWQRKKIVPMLKNTKNSIFSWYSLLYIAIILGIAFFTSRGVEHSDTGLYHAQAIRWIEEYGVIKGLGNLFVNYAYNSSYLCFVALFSMKFLTGVSLHTTNGLIAAVLCCYSLRRLTKFGSHQKHTADALCISILFYTLVAACTLMSPSTDFPAMILSIYCLMRFAETIDDNNGDSLIYSSFANLSVLAVYIATVKLSAGCLVILVLSPMIWLIKNKKLKEIGIYLSTGIIILIPFLIRNVILSGWLLYPFEAIDLFSFDWKIPKQEVIADATQIKVYARCLYDSSLIDLPFSTWIFTWWENQERYEQMLILANVVAFAGYIIHLLQKIFIKSKIDWNEQLLSLTGFICTVFWLFTAPFVRYGLAFLLANPLIFLSNAFKHNKLNLLQLTNGLCVGLTIWMLFPYFDHYIMDDLVFAKQHLTEWEYYLVQKDYETYDMTAYQVGEYTFYYPSSGDKAGYYGYPGGPASKNGDIELRGSDISEGLRVTTTQ